MNGILKGPQQFWIHLHGQQELLWEIVTSGWVAAMLQHNDCMEALLNEWYDGKEKKLREPLEMHWLTMKDSQF
jgi:hypothetical protein